MTARGRAPVWWARVRPYLPWIVAAPFTVSGMIHLIHPTTFTPIVPHVLPAPTALVYASGVAELICAVGLWHRSRWAGIAAALLLLVIWPANFQDSITALHGHDSMIAVLLWIRLPVQIPLIWCALQSGASPSRHGRRRDRRRSRHGSSPPRNAVEDRDRRTRRAHR